MPDSNCPKEDTPKFTVADKAPVKDPNGKVIGYVGRVEHTAEGVIGHLVITDRSPDLMRLLAGSGAAIQFDMDAGEPLVMTGVIDKIREPVTHRMGNRNEPSSRYASATDFLMHRIPEGERGRFRRMVWWERVKMNIVQFFYDRIPAYARWVDKKYES